MKRNTGKSLVSKVRVPRNRLAWRNEGGQGLSEYLILVLLVAVVSIAAARTLGTTVKKKIQLAERHLEKVSVE